MSNNYIVISYKTDAPTSLIPRIYNNDNNP